MDIILATNNAHKVQELRRMLEPLGYTLYSQKEKGISIEVEENGTTFEENAFLKAKAIYDLTGCAALADDSGLCVDAMDGVENRAAQFVSVICYIDPQGKDHYFRGECPGEVGFEEKGDGGFGYDPLFMVGEKSYAEMTGAEKDAVSHRGRAIRLLADYLGR